MAQIKNEDRAVNVRIAGELIGSARALFPRKRFAFVVADHGGRLMLSVLCEGSSRQPRGAGFPSFGEPEMYALAVECNKQLKLRKASIHKIMRSAGFGVVDDLLH